MKLYESIYNKLNSNKIFCFIFLPISFSLFSLAFMLLAYPKAASKGVTDGINICLETVIPSLFPFLLLSGIAYDCGIFDLITRRCEKITTLLFALPSVALPIIIMSFLGGFPVGALLTEKAYERGRLSRLQAERMMLFCVNPGPAFVVSTVGYSMIGSEEAGLILYAGITAASLIIGVLSRFLAENDTAALYVGDQCKPTLKPDFILSETVSSCTKNMLNICVWVIIFSCMEELTEIIVTNKNALIFLKMIAEVTNGAIAASEHFSLPVIAAVISFAGLCVHLQIMPCLTKIKLRYKYFLCVRILTASLSCVLTLLLLELFPQYTQVVSMGVKPEAAAVKSSFPTCVWLMLMCGLFVIGDNYIIHRKSERKRSDTRTT